MYSSSATHDIVTQRMARGVAADVAFLIDIVETLPAGARTRKVLLAWRRGISDYQVSSIPGSTSSTQTVPAISRRDLEAMRWTRSSRSNSARPIRSQARRGRHNMSICRSQLKDGVLHIVDCRATRLIGVQRRHLHPVDGGFVARAAGVAILFLRNQVRPIERLALRGGGVRQRPRRARFQALWRDRSAPRAAQAFITMRERIERYVQQRTEMLAGVSHDLKTPLTRMKLQLAMMGEGADTTPLREDIAEMEHMLDEYLDFARGEGGEECQSVDLSEVLRRSRARRRSGPTATAG